ncbi:MAG: hypothetical protein NTX05_07835 [Fusobacteria bacterium]|nr:hypothetical protein [Fusobacteriota bacterium]
MSVKPFFVNTSFSFAFELKADIQDFANVIGSYLINEYEAAQLNNVPPNTDPSVPRVAFTAKDGMSQIVLSQVNMALNIGFPVEIREDSEKVMARIIDQVDYLKDIVEELCLVMQFSGIMNFAKINLTGEVSSTEAIKNLAAKLSKSTDVNNLYDLEYKTTKVVENTYYSNVSIKNYKSFPKEVFEKFKGRVPNGEITEYGIDVLIDFNDRFVFNENSAYSTTVESWDILIKESFKKLETEISILN